MFLLAGVGAGAFRHWCHLLWQDLAVTVSVRPHPVHTLPSHNNWWPHHCSAEPQSYGQQYIKFTIIIYIYNFFLCFLSNMLLFLITYFIFSVVSFFKLSVNFLQVSSIILINCGGSMDLSEELQLPSNITVFVTDTHRPLHVCNIYSRDQVYENLLFINAIIAIYIAWNKSWCLCLVLVIHSLYTCISIIFFSWWFYVTTILPIGVAFE